MKPKTLEISEDFVCFFMFIFSAFSMYFFHLSLFFFFGFVFFLYVIFFFSSFFLFLSKESEFRVKSQFVGFAVGTSSRNGSFEVCRCEIVWRYSHGSQCDVYGCRKCTVRRTWQTC